MYLSVRTAVVVAGAGVAAAVLPYPVWLTLLVVNGILAAIVATDVARAPRAALLRIERSVPTVSAIHRMDRIALEIHNPLPRSIEIAVRDASPPSLRRRPRSQRAVVASEAWTTLPAEITPTRRGYARLGPMTVRTAGPLRLGGRQARLETFARIKVYPPLPGRAHVAQRIQRARELQVGSRSSAFRGGGNEFDTLRDYHPDDEFRRIDWAATARTGKPITRIYREERDQQVMLLLDAGRMMAGSVGGVSRFEHAIDAGFTLAELAAYVGDRVGMLAFGGQVAAMIGPRGGRDQPRRILDLLFDVEPSLEAPDYTRAFATMLSRHRRRALLVVLTEITDERAMEPLMVALPALRARHLVVLGAIQDPDVVALARSNPEDAQGAYAKAAAAESLAMRDRAAARLRGIGVAVEDRRPGELASAVADRYLAIKSAGRL
jgi:uncharacterized protein (DUF58 family)